MRDIIRLFADRESRDELGLGQIRDAIGDGLFPGTSTLLTRARYLLFVPWAYQLASGRRHPTVEADLYERQAISAIRGTDDYAGLLGMQAGAALKTLPSSVYWSMLRHYGILTDPSLSRDDALRLHGLHGGIDDPDGASGARFRAWSPTLPKPPDGFPKTIAGGFALTADEASWLRDRILDGAPDSLIAHLALYPPAPESPAPWADAAAREVQGDSKTLLHHAQMFSTAMHGAQLLYNLMLAEQYEAAGLTAVANPVDRYRSELETWAERLPSDLATWDLDAFLTRVEVARGTPIHPRTRAFVQKWTDLIRRTNPAHLAGNDTARDLVTTRERQNKGAQARLGNPRRLQSWRGGSGAGALVYRWPQVRQILLDIHDGLARTPEANDA